MSFRVGLAMRGSARKHSPVTGALIHGPSSARPVAAQSGAIHVVPDENNTDGTGWPREGRR